MNISSNDYQSLTEDEVIEMILDKFHGHTREQWDTELSNHYPWNELPSLVKMVWEKAQQEIVNKAKS